MLQKFIDEYLVAWGASIRVNERTLKRPNMPQSRYSIETAGVILRQNECDSVSVLGLACEVRGDGSVVSRDPQSHSVFVVASDEMKMVFKVMATLDREVALWLQGHYAMAGSVPEKSSAIGVSQSTWKRRVRDAKVVFGAALWVRSQTGLKVQRGVMMKNLNCSA